MIVIVIKIFKKIHCSWQVEFGSHNQSGTTWQTPQPKICLWHEGNGTMFIIRLIRNFVAKTSLKVEPPCRTNSSTFPTKYGDQHFGSFLEGFCSSHILNEPFIVYFLLFFPPIFNSQKSQMKKKWLILCFTKQGTKELNINHKSWKPTCNHVITIVPLLKISKKNTNTNLK